MAYRNVVTHFQVARASRPREVTAKRAVPRQQVDSMDSANSRRPDERGFTLLEVLVAMAIVVTGLMYVAYGIGQGLQAVQMSTLDTIAREKAQEAMEDIFTARDTGMLNFQTQLCNVGSGASCLFVVGYTPMNTADTLGLVNTTAAEANPVETYWVPGPSGVLGNPDQPAAVKLTSFQRQIQVSTAASSDGYDTLAQITVTIMYSPAPGVTRYTTMVAIMSPYV